MRRSGIITSLASLAITSGLGSVPWTAATAGSPDDLVTASLVAEVRSIQPGRPFWLAIRLEMNDGWHVNWINPGDAGLAPTVVWDLPDGFRAGGLHWPFPEKFSLPELCIFGYGDEVFVLTEITPPPSFDSASPVEIRARANWLACREVCIPDGADLEIGLELGDDAPEADPVWVESFRRTRMALPVVAEGWRFSARLSDDRIFISAVPPDGEEISLDTVTFFPTIQGMIENASPQKLSREGPVYTLDIERARMGWEERSRLQGVLVSSGGWGRIPQKALTIDIPID
jgi:thiol:disulfide interchange protein DsbD